MVHQGGQAAHRIDLHPLHQGGLGRILFRHIDPFQAVLPGHRDHGQDAVGVAYRPVQRKFSHHQGFLQVGGHLAGGHAHAQGHGQVVGRPLLAQVRRGQVDGDLLVGGEKRPGVAHAGPNPLPRLLDGGIGQAHHAEGRDPVGDIHLHLDDGSLQPHDGTTGDSGQHLPPPFHLYYSISSRILQQTCTCCFHPFRPGGRWPHRRPCLLGGACPAPVEENRPLWYNRAGRSEEAWRVR